MQAAARQFQTVRKEISGGLDDILNVCFQGSDGTRLLGEICQDDIEAADRLSRAVTTLPDVGGTFFGFRLVALLGSGAFGRVYLAQQGDLADRSVALKIAADIFGESQTLAQLQHTNIVPVYSIHRANPFQAVCMPYFGATTLADVLEHLEGGKSLPDSGKMLVSTVKDRKLSVDGSYSKSTVREGFGPTPLGDQPPGAGPSIQSRAAGAAEALQKLEGMSYVEAVLWMVARLADGLAHAHQRGILHRDLKPANILVTDDGQPMLLDFNLSEDTKLRSSATAASIGGTLPYMAPEHLRAFQVGGQRLDARCDLYSLGVILYELLTGRPPFPGYRAVSSETLESMIADRQKTRPEVQGHNGAVSPAIESIVRRCLEPDPAKRYRGARHLQEDIERQLQNQVLKHRARAILARTCAEMEPPASARGLDHDHRHRARQLARGIGGRAGVPGPAAGALRSQCDLHSLSGASKARPFETV